MRLLFTFLLICSTATAAEIIQPDFSNVRGLNYIASYAPSDVAMWRFYDHQMIDHELGLIQRMGGNSVRVWLAWAVYDVEGQQFIEKFADFLSLCEKHQITVMPILWDSCFGDPRAGYDDVKDWVANPGTERVADPEFLATGDEYVRAVVEAGRKSPALLIWDVMNEPSGKRINRWLEHYCRLVKSIDAKHPVTIGWAHAKSNATSAAWVDVMSYHPYGIFKKNRQIWTDQVRRISREHGDKPILVTEAGSPAWGQRYEECIADFERQRVGFYVFEAMVGTNRFNQVTGFFYPDGSVRELKPVRAFAELARRQGAQASDDFPVNPDGPGFPVVGEKQAAQMIFDWDQQEITPQNQAHRQNVLRWTLISLAWGGALKDHIAEVQSLDAKAKTALEAGDVDEVKRIWSRLAKIAAKLLVEHEFVEPPRS
jgi:hypothetical protein